MLGYGVGHPPESIKRYANLHDDLIKAFSAYADEVAQGIYPSLEAGPRMKADELSEFRKQLKTRRRRSVD
jgi:3-methyl-2-oxobutanoate hydroxymethyltransferase